MGGAEAPPVRGDDVPLPGQGIDHELEGGGNVHPAVEQEEGGGRGIAPTPDVEAAAGEVDEFGAVGVHREIPALNVGKGAE